MPSAGGGESSNYELVELRPRANKVVILGQNRRAALSEIDNAKFWFVYFYLPFSGSVNSCASSVVGSMPKFVLLQALAFSLRRPFVLTVLHNNILIIFLPQLRHLRHQYCINHPGLCVRAGRSTQPQTRSGCEGSNPGWNPRWPAIVRLAC